MVARCLNCKAMEFHELNLLPKSALYVYWKRNINNVECEPQWAPISKDNQDGGEWFRTWDSLGAAFHSDFPAAWKWREALSHTVRSLPVMCGSGVRPQVKQLENQMSHTCALYLINPGVSPGLRVDGRSKGPMGPEPSAHTIGSRFSGWVRLLLTGGTLIQIPWRTSLSHVEPQDNTWISQYWGHASARRNHWNSKSAS